VLLTFLIADIRGYTRFTAERGDEAAAQLAGRFAALARTVAGARGGEVIEFRGDEALAVFPSARQALRAALDLQEQFAQTTEVDPSLPLRVGIGLDAGEAIPVEAGYRGGALNLAARLCSLAGPGEVFCSETVVGLARKTDGIACIDRGKVTLKGLSSLVRVIQIAPEGALSESLPPLQHILATHPTNLPDEPTPFIGREQEIERITALLRDPYIRMVTLTGPGGTGKTRLALQVGNTVLYDFRDGVFFVNLAPLTDPVLVPSAITQVLGVKEEVGKGMVESLTEHLIQKHLLLVLDNYEHLLAAAPMVSTLLDACRELHVLVTSRIPLHLSREREHAVPALSIPDLRHLPGPRSLSHYESVALFVDRARAARDGFDITDENAPAVAEICSRLDGLALAIELAAARIKLFPPQALLQRLSSRLRLLTGGARDRPTRQQTLRNTIDWSYSLLSADEHVLFARLSAFAGGCTFEAAEAVCTPEGNLDLLDLLASLVDKSLIRQEGQEEPRFEMLETIREYAAEKLEERGDGEEMRARHARCFLQLAEEAEPELTGPQQGEWLARLEAELDNLRGALRQLIDRRMVTEALRLASALFRFWHQRAYWSEGRRWLEEGLAAAGETVLPQVRAAALWALAALSAESGERERAAILLEEALALYQDLEDRRGSARVLNGLGNVAFLQGQYEQATIYLEKSIALSRELGDAERLAISLANLSNVVLDTGDWTTAKERCQEALTNFQSTGNADGIGWMLGSLGLVALARDRLAEAEAMLEKSLAVSREAGTKPRIAFALENLGELALKQQRLEQSRDLLRESIRLARELGDVRVSIRLLGEIAAVAVAQGEAERAARLKGAEAELGKRRDIPTAPARRAESAAVVAESRSVLGEESFARAWERGRGMSLQEAIAFALEADG